MARRTYLMTLAVLVFILAANLQPAHSSPINWDKVDLTKEQEQTVKKVDGLLNELLKQLEEMFRDKPKKNPTGDQKHSTGEVDASIHSEEVPVDEVGHASTNPVDVPVDEDGHASTNPVDVPVDEVGEAESDENDDHHKIVFPQHNK